MFGQGPGVEGCQQTLLSQQHGSIGPIAGVHLVTHGSKEGQLVHEAWVRLNPRGPLLQRLRRFIRGHVLCDHQKRCNHLPKPKRGQLGQDSDM